jgi:CDGSH iron-sulfur domain-containing protein 3
MRSGTGLDCRRRRAAIRGYARVVSDVSITVRANGPYKVVGPIRIVDAEGREFELPEGSAVALCRCGHSRTKPFCDASHKRVGFIGDETAPRVGSHTSP